MNINIRGEKMVVTDAIKKYINQRFNRLSKYFTEESEINSHVLIKVKGHNQTIEITIPTKKFTLRAEETSNDLYTSIDLVIEKLESQIRKNKNRILSKSNKDNIKVIDYSMDFEETDYNDNKIVKRKVLEMKPMSEEEAILQMNLLSHSFFAFKNIDTENISVLYLRKDGDYGIIDLE